MSISLTKGKLEDLLSLVKTNTKISFTGVSYIASEVRGGELFFSFPDKSENVQQTLEIALNRGAALAIVQDAKLVSLDPERILYVSDCLAAFYKLAKWWKHNLKIPTILICNSQENSAVKELTASILLQHSQGYYSLQASDPKLDLAYAILSSNPSHKWLILELEKNYSNYAELAAADVLGLVSAASDLDYKYEVLQFANNKIVYNSEISSIKEIINQLPLQSDLKITAFGRGEECGISNIKSLALQGLEFDIKLYDQIFKVKIKVIGQENAYSAGFAAVLAKSLIPELSQDLIETGLRRFMSPDKRLQTIRLNSGQVIVDQTYNANLSSTKAAFALAAELISAGNSIGLVLGDLTGVSKEINSELAKQAVSLKPKYIVYLGKHYESYAAACSISVVAFFHVASAEAAAFTVEKLMAQIILCNASAEIALGTCVQKLIEIKGMLQDFDGGK